MADDVIISTDRHCIRLEGEPGDFSPLLSARDIGPGRHVVTLRLAADQAHVPPPLRLAWAHPTIDIQGRWHPGLKRDRSLSPDWESKHTTRLVHSAPLVSLYNLNGTNRLTFACSEVADPVDIGCGVHEETAAFACSIGLFAHAPRPIRQAEVRLLIDTRDVPYHEAIRDVRLWWEHDGGYAPLPAPDAARLPVYSTWYAFHQSLEADTLVHQCRLAREMGCESVIVDDGWQTTDTYRGYGYCGDWKPVRLPAMADLVRRIHELGMKFLLWYGPPFAGIHSEICRRFADRQMEYVEGAKTGILDPRYPEVRAYLLDTLETALREWDLDGFKLDFVDFFDPLKVKGTAAGMDIEDMVAATNQFFADLLARLRAIKPDVMIEFRQPYVGPAMRQYANMLRSFDCPNDAMTNRVNTTDLRLLAGRTAVHSDMFMWNNDDAPESAALQLINVLFTVPQVSVRIDTLSAPHTEMLRFWLQFCREHRDVLLDGELTPQAPESLYPVITASNNTTRIVVVYADTVAFVGADVPDELFVVNGSRRGRVAVELTEPLHGRRVEILDARGWLVRKDAIDLAVGIHALDIPPAGLSRIVPDL